MLHRTPFTGLLGAACAALLLAGCGETTSGPGDNRAERVLTITGPELRDWIALLSDDSMMGRSTPSPELDEAATAIADRFRQLGLSGAFGGEFVQRYPVSSTEQSPNVGGLLEGSDSRLRAEVVVFVAHFDHIGPTFPRGTCPVTGADTVCNGANDNASGTAAVLELAEAFAGMEPLPKRSLLFLAVSGEEHGLWGSQYFVAHPPVPAGNIVAALDMDMIGRNAQDSIFVGGLYLSTLGDRALAMATVHREEGLRLAYIGQGGSDDVSFASGGIPSLMFFNGLHADYHKPSDTVDRLDPELAARVTRLVFHLGLDVANAPGRPQWKPIRAAPRPEAR